MLPAAFRLRDRTLLTTTVRRGTRAGRRYLVLHFLPCESVQTVSASGPVPPRIAFAVNRAVGGSVVRHRVTRRLRQIVVDRIHQLPDGSALVVRALPAAAHASSTELDAELATLIGRVCACV